MSTQSFQQYDHHNDKNKNSNSNNYFDKDDIGRLDCRSPPPSPGPINNYSSSSSSLDGNHHPSSPESEIMSSSSSSPLPLPPSSRSHKNTMMSSAPSIQQTNSYDNHCWNNNDNDNVNVNNNNMNYQSFDVDEDEDDGRMMIPTTTTKLTQQQTHSSSSSSSTASSSRRRYARHNNATTQNRSSTTTSTRGMFWTTVVKVAFRSMLDIGVWAIFAVFVSTLFLHKMHDDYIYPMLQLMLFRDVDRDQTDITYYHRRCNEDDFMDLNATFGDLVLFPPSGSILPFSSSASASPGGAVSSSTTILQKNETIRLDITTPRHGHQPNIIDTTPRSSFRNKPFANKAAEHMLTYGVSVYPDLLRDTTMRDLRTWILQETDRRERDSWHVQNGKHRISWGFDMNDRHGGKEILHQFWKDLATVNPSFLDALEAVLGPDPAVMEFAHITAEYGATDQTNHPDVSAYESPAKFARSFAPSYTLFIPLQDTTYEMGATHICPGSHICGTGAEGPCNKYNIAMSGGRARQKRGGRSKMGSTDTSSTWQAGWGALMNSQAIHRGMAHTDRNAMERVVICVTFVPRPNWARRGQMDTRMLGTYDIVCVCGGGGEEGVHYHDIYNGNLLCR
jgi:ectoine hydroxylase-related dioxygenase (phytanoyl-CoA dioxygenase family)